MTILCSAPRQAQLVPVLCAFTNFSLRPDTVDELCGLAPGDARLLLRGLHSVLEVPEDEPIDTYHASFLDFLKNQRCSQQFYINSLPHRMDMAPAFLKLDAEEDLIPLLVSLPPSTELLALIQAMNPDYIPWFNPPVRSLLPWLKHNISNVPELLPILVGISLSFFGDKSLRHLRAVLGITWEKLREIICSFRPNVAGDETISGRSPPRRAIP
ncbi:hypothetical protein K438DRAFT_1786560 [Mycena galopus ATCC 62051]|nr:hypothetical protein K438DRAFT_1786560 [Mycena galopus ATCC 62051]